MQAKTKEILQYLLGGLIVFAFFLTIALLVFFPMPESSKDALLVLLGALAAQFKDVGSYFFGSSKSSADKTEFLSQK